MKSESEINLEVDPLFKDHVFKKRVDVARLELPRNKNTNSRSHGKSGGVLLSFDPGSGDLLATCAENSMLLCVAMYPPRIVAKTALENVPGAKINYFKGAEFLSNPYY